MITQNCASIGSLVHRAQGYKKLKDDSLMASKSKFYIPDSRNRTHYLVSDRCRAYVKSNNRCVHFDGGTLIESLNTTRRPSNDVEVKVIDVSKRRDNDEYTYRCSTEKLIELDEKVFRLLAAIKSPTERVKIAKDTSRCDELRTIGTDSVVKLSNYYLGLVLSKKIANNGSACFEVLVQVSLITCLVQNSINLYF